METYRVLIYLESAAQPICYDAITAYEKGSFYCVVHQGKNGRVVTKYPVASIFRLEAEYAYIEVKSVRASADVT